jgi:hypothetical protein
MKLAVGRLDRSLSDGVGSASGRGRCEALVRRANEVGTRSAVAARSGQPYVGDVEQLIEVRR